MKPHKFTPFKTYTRNSCGERKTLLSDWCAFCDVTFKELVAMPEEQHSEHFCHRLVNDPIHQEAGK